MAKVTVAKLQKIVAAMEARIATLEAQAAKTVVVRPATTFAPSEASRLRDRAGTGPSGRHDACDRQYGPEIRRPDMGQRVMWVRQGRSAPLSFCSAADVFRARQFLRVTVVTAFLRSLGKEAVRHFSRGYFPL